VDKYSDKRNSDSEAIRFFRSLKTLIRQTNGTLLLTVDESMVSPFLMSNIFYLADSVLKLTSFRDHPEMKFGEYDGTLRLLKQPRLNGIISAPLSEFDVYAVRLKRSGLVFERIHLEPEHDRAEQDENLRQKPVASVACNPTKKQVYEF